METHMLGSRVYGCRYDRTRIFKRLSALAGRMIADLSSTPRFPGIPAQGVFSVRIVCGLILQVEVGGLSDDFLFSDYTDAAYSTPAIDLRAQIMRFIETYNWCNRQDARDRRFVSSVRLLAESEYRSAFWTPGLIRLSALY